MAQAKPYRVVMTVELPQVRNVPQALDAAKALVERVSSDIDIGLAGNTVVQPRVAGANITRPAPR